MRNLIPVAVVPLALAATLAATATAAAPAGDDAPPANPDVAALLALHERALAAHRANDVGALVEPESDDYVMGNRGELFFPAKDERVARLGPYLAQTRFTAYRDVVAPVVRVSDDGTLGWVICQVRIEGTRTLPAGETRAVDSTWTWIELYEKRDGRWLRTGNVSTMKPVE